MNTGASPSACVGGFKESLLSGWLDGELTQGDEQRVRVHLEQCPHCTAVLEEMSQLRNATGASNFREPEDHQWDERPKGSLSAFARNIGWLLVIGCALVLGGLALVDMLSSGGSLWAVLPGLVLWLGFGALGVSVLIDRLKELPKDRYRNIQK